jgi:hypothetical protein
MIEVSYIDHMGNDDTIVNANLTFTQRRILEAVERGYHVKNNKLFGPKGELKIVAYGKQKYPTFSTNWGGRVYGIPTHKLAAYIYYGTDSFYPGLVVRHLNGNVLDISKENIVLGTHSDNNLDKPPEVRKKAAIKARASQPKESFNAKLTQEKVLFVKSFYSDLQGKKAPNGTVSNLVKLLGVSRTTLCHIKNGKRYAD